MVNAVLRKRRPRRLRAAGRRDARRAPRCATRTRAGSCDLWWDWLGARRDARAAGGRQPPAESRSASTRSWPTRRAELPDGPSTPLASRPSQRRVLVQSSASQRVSTLVDPQPGERVLDLCSAPGNKTTHLAALMGDRGRGRRLRAPRRAAPRRSRPHVRAAAARRSSRSSASDAADATGSFDRVLLDPPCIGPGHAVAQPRPALADDARARSTGCSSSRSGCSRRRSAACAPGGPAGLQRLHALPAEERLPDGRRSPHAGPTGTAPTASILPPRWLRTSTSGRRARTARALAAPDQPPGPLPLRLLPAPLRAGVGVPGLRGALHDRAHDHHRAASRCNACGAQHAEQPV